MLTFTTTLFQHCLAQSPVEASGGSVVKPANSEDTRMVEIERRLNAVTGALNQTQQLLEQSMQEIQRLRGELETLRAQVPGGPSSAGVAEVKPEVPGPDHAAVASSGAPTKEDFEALREEQDALQAEIKQHEQTKVETTSKYPLRVSGLVLFNAFSNNGVVDNAELPVLALPRNPGSSHGSTGATLRQTLLALEATGPRIGGARSAASVSIDFFGGVSSNTYGYNNSQGSVRMRQSQASLEWDKTTAEVGYTVPLISPLSPTSYSTVAQPALSGAGNLWTWSPQIRVEQRIPLSDRSRFGLEAGLISPPSPNYTSTQLDTPVEASRRPGYEGRVSYRLDSKDGSLSKPFVFGVGAYSASQFYNSATQIHSWAVTGDWQVPLTQHFELSGEIFRGRALGGFGGGAYKDVLMGMDAVSGLNRTVGLDTTGGWSQLKTRFSTTFEANAMFGLDNTFASNFAGLVLTTTTNPLQAYARNQSVVGNLIFRPKTYLILSPEYRRIQSWRYTGRSDLANIFSFAAGFQF